MKQKLKSARKRLYLTMADVAKKIGISEGAYCNIENGKRTPSVKTAKNIATLLELDWTDFF